MNKFATPELQPLIDRMRQASLAVYLATEETVADDISGMFKDAADSLEAADRYWLSVESALA